MKVKWDDFPGETILKLDEVRVLAGATKNGDKNQTTTNNENNNIDNNKPTNNNTNKSDKSNNNSKNNNNTSNNNNNNNLDTTELGLESSAEPSQETAHEANSPNRDDEPSSEKRQKRQKAISPSPTKKNWVSEGKSGPGKQKKLDNFFDIPAKKVGQTRLDSFFGKADKSSQESGRRGDSESEGESSSLEVRMENAEESDNEERGSKNEGERSENEDERSEKEDEGSEKGGDTDVDPVLEERLTRKYSRGSDNADKNQTEKSQNAAKQTETQTGPPKTTNQEKQPNKQQAEKQHEVDLLDDFVDEEERAKKTSKEAKKGKRKVKRRRSKLDLSSSDSDSDFAAGEEEESEESEEEEKGKSKRGSHGKEPKERRRKSDSEESSDEDERATKRRENGKNKRLSARETLEIESDESEEEEKAKKRRTNENTQKDMELDQDEEESEKEEKKKANGKKKTISREKGKGKRQMANGKRGNKEEIRQEEEEEEREKEQNKNKKRKREEAEKKKNGSSKTNGTSGAEEKRSTDGNYFSAFYDTDHGSEVDSDDGKTPNTNEGGKSRGGKKIANTGKKMKNWKQHNPKHLKEISIPQEMFTDMVRKQPKLGNFAAKLKRPLRLATVCSGTEAPIMAMDMICKAVKELYNETIEFEHVFSCEIEPYKQAYIERNFAPPILFRDVRELGNGDEATTAYGARVKIPGDIDIMIAGTSCVDYSNKNTKKKKLVDMGESGQTFLGLYLWVEKNKPKVIIIENIVNSPWELMQAFLESLGYTAGYIKIDTKKFYVPQTRNRRYIFFLKITI
eukprot:Phypoly_transcript_02411.p1 GENE.Phypoly_transcript_02411~~Phypoly_transcript_02411.p1  ORF type:complete len:912 (+),score=272.34 Phypoly_transcript_02411:349-2736(+)